METQHSTIPILDFVKGVQSKEYNVDRDYQRSDAVWPSVAKSFLIETILLNFPVPKLSLHQKLDVKTRTVVKNIVDGQQRTRAIQDFYENKLRLSRVNIHDDFAGRTFSQLEEAHQAQFMNYGMDFDIFVGASNEEVREIFRRMNSFTVPLNPEEKRHSTFQGPFKWFMNKLTRDYDDAFETSGVFTLKQLNRMQDAKLLTEVVKAMLDGISTTSKASLDAIYRKYDKDFPRQTDVGDALRPALQFVLSFEEIRGTPLMKTYNVYSLLLAHMHVNGTWSLGEDYVGLHIDAFEEGDVAYNFSLLSEAIEAGDDIDEDSEFASFVEATTERTNVTDQRTTRFDYFVAALS